MSTNGFADFSVAGTGPTRTDESLSFTFAAAGPSANGRGTLSSTDSGGTANFVYYVVSAGTILVLRTDAAATTGVAGKQNLPFSTTTVNTGGAVFALTGVDVAKTNDISAIGQLQVTNATSGILNWDSNDAGTIVGPISVSSQAVTFDPTTGRGTITVANGFTKGLFDSAVFYLLDSGKGFIVDTTAGTNNRALAGSFRGQTGGGSFGLSTFTNKMILRAGGTSPNDAGTLDGLLSLGSNSTFALTLDARTPGLADIVNQTLNGLQISAIDANTGRGTLTIPGTSFNASEAIYIVGPNQFAMIDVTPAPNNFATPILFFDPQ